MSAEFRLSFDAVLSILSFKSKVFFSRFEHFLKIVLSISGSGLQFCFSFFFFIYLHSKVSFVNNFRFGHEILGFLVLNWR